jgi:hypothetical protein
MITSRNEEYGPDTDLCHLVGGIPGNVEGEVWREGGVKKGVKWLAGDSLVRPKPCELVAQKGLQPSVAVGPRAPVAQEEP